MQHGLQRLVAVFVYNAVTGNRLLKKWQSSVRELCHPQAHPNANAKKKNRQKAVKVCYECSHILHVLHWHKKGGFLKF